MSVVSWAIAIVAAIIALLSIAIAILSLMIRASRARVEELRREIEASKRRMADLVATIELMSEPDPTGDELLHEAAAAAAAAGGLSAVEQGAADRLVRARADRRAGEEDGR